MFLQLLQPKKAVYCFKNCKNYCDDSFSKEKGQKGFPMYQNLSIIMSSMYLEKKVNKFLQLNMPLLFLGYLKYEWNRNEREFMWFKNKIYTVTSVT